LVKSGADFKDANRMAKERANNEYNEKVKLLRGNANVIQSQGNEPLKTSSLAAIGGGGNVQQSGMIDVMKSQLKFIKQIAENTGNKPQKSSGINIKSA